MADTLVVKRFDIDCVKPEAQKRWLEAKVEEKKSLVHAIQQKLRSHEGDLIMVKEELKHWEAELEKL